MASKEDPYSTTGLTIWLNMQQAALPQGVGSRQECVSLFVARGGTSFIGFIRFGVEDFVDFTQSDFIGEME